MYFVFATFLSKSRWSVKAIKWHFISTNKKNSEKQTRLDACFIRVLVWFIRQRFSFSPKIQIIWISWRRQSTSVFFIRLLAISTCRSFRRSPENFPIFFFAFMTFLRNGKSTETHEVYLRRSDE